jgi:hypothetical protein
MAEQGSQEWLEMRLGHVTASNVAKVLAKGEGKTRESYKWDLISQRLTKVIEEGYTNAEMQHGKDTEFQARMAYEVANDVFVQQVDFIKHPTIDWVGVSPDGLINDDGLVEIKCPKTVTHLNTYATKQVPKQYIPQMQMQMWITGRNWNDFVSFDPRLPVHLQYICIRLFRDEEYLKVMQLEVEKLLAEIEIELAQFKG